MQVSAELVHNGVLHLLARAGVLLIEGIFEGTQNVLPFTV